MVTLSKTSGFKFTPINFATATRRFQLWTLTALASNKITIFWCLRLAADAMIGCGV
jgi:hypothetical protein